ncbi:unnamed protein product [Vitrella brassicaformis CCMP3155]|uniref:SAC domain-containing protein n=1 Tax=Vitrella brassicaformis (strain CCMP3155) TaxID=1169540 RepID=A0A0G4F7T8_VITBC|nr:unnamed protein product [Vitrella brassicaformis CCMP3155]|eukprot:CEM08057.1 unnamed protein product [Vitrella brassicaformis CCMP3155]
MTDARLIFHPFFSVEIHDDRVVVRRAPDQASLHLLTHDGTVRMELLPPPQPSPPLSALSAWACLGTLTFGAVRYLVVVTECLYTGDIVKRPVFEIRRCEFLRIDDGGDGEEDAESKLAKDMVAELLHKGGFYFSQGWDLTRTARQLRGAGDGWSDFHYETPRVLKCDPRFVWNRRMLEGPITAHAPNWTTMVINGCVLMHEVPGMGRNMKLVLISRRDCRRAGVRFHRRGVNQNGYASNFVETEQLLICHQGGRYRICSHVQTRGSIPLVWKQPPNLKWAPKAKICGDFSANFAAGTRHLEECVKLYGRNLLINLVDMKSWQKRLGDAFTRVVEETESPNLHYIWFDFHKECRKMQWHNLSKLMGQIQDDLDHQAYTLIELHDVPSTNPPPPPAPEHQEPQQNGPIEGGRSDTLLTDRPPHTKDMALAGQVLLKQSGVCRTNCVDCLDRTNVVQSLLARRSLRQQLKRLCIGYTDDGTHASDDPFAPLANEDFEQLFRDAWADNADALSALYAGTPALKTDFTRLGKRTTAGLLQDGKNAIHRYFLNNLVDGYSQDCCDLLLYQSPSLSCDSDSPPPPHPTTPRSLSPAPHPAHLKPLRKPHSGVRRVLTEFMLLLVIPCLLFDQWRGFLVTAVSSGFLLGQVGHRVMVEQMLRAIEWFLLPTYATVIGPMRGLSRTVTLMAAGSVTRLLWIERYAGPLVTALHQLDASLASLPASLPARVLSEGKVWWLLGEGFAPESVYWFMQAFSWLVECSSGVLVVMAVLSVACSGWMLLRGGAVVSKPRLVSQ